MRLIETTYNQLRSGYRQIVNKEQRVSKKEYSQLFATPDNMMVAFKSEDSKYVIFESLDKKIKIVREFI